MNMPALIPFNA